MRKLWVTVFTIGGILFWYFLFQSVFNCDDEDDESLFYINKELPVEIKKELTIFIQDDTNLFSEVKKLIGQAPVAVQDRLFLIDREILKDYENAFSSEEGNKSCVFCDVEDQRTITFALLCPGKTIKDNELLPVVKAWEAEFNIQIITSSHPRKYPAYDANFPLGFILQKERGSVVIEIVLFHYRNGNFWWHGSFQLDDQYKSKLNNFGLLDATDDFLLKQEGAYDKFQSNLIVVDGTKLNVPRDVKQFLQTPSQFIECNYEQAEKYYKINPKDTSGKTANFAERVKKILVASKAALDYLQIPFWLSSGTLLGYYRQCDIIPYTTDVDIGVFIKDYKDTITLAFRDRKLKRMYKFGKVSEGLELSFKMNNVKIDIFFFYDGGDHYWNGGHMKNSSKSVVEYKYKFSKFNLCWTEFLETKFRIPCETEEYILDNYGPNWFTPSKKWEWNKSPPNVQVLRVYTDKEDVKEVLQIFR